MPRSRKPELLPPASTPALKPDLNALLTKAVEQKVAEVLARQEEAIFQPWFQPKSIANAIRRGQTVTEQRKWTLYYAKWGCVRCNTKKANHVSLGMCKRCRDLIRDRLYEILRKHTPKNQHVPLFTDPERQAHQALLEPVPQPAECTGEMGIIDRIAQAQHALKKPKKALPAGPTRRNQ